MSELNPNAVRANEYDFLATEAQLAFIARMVSEYKAHLVKRVSGLQAFIEDERFIQDKEWGRSQLAEAMRRLELSDAELLLFIGAAEPKLAS